MALQGWTTGPLLMLLLLWSSSTLPAVSGVQKRQPAPNAALRPTSWTERPLIAAGHTSQLLHHSHHHHLHTHINTPAAQSAPPQQVPPFTVSAANVRGDTLILDVGSLRFQVRVECAGLAGAPLKEQEQELAFTQYLPSAVDTLTTTLAGQPPDDAAHDRSSWLC
jgi:hypothetical protein